jgi:putative methionine-R-sulfoxide reductase with GAF domain
MSQPQFARIQDVLRRLQAEKGYFSIAVYAVEGDHAVRVAEAGAICSQCSRVDLSSGNIGLVARTGTVHFTRDVSSDPSYKSCFAEVRSEIAAPIIDSGKVLGVVDVEMDSGHSLAEPEELDILAVAAQLAPLLRRVGHKGCDT